IQLVDSNNAIQVYPAIHCFRKIGAYLDNKFGLQPHMDGQRVDLIDIGAAADSFSRLIDDDVDLMRRAPHAHHIEIGATRDKSHEI
ncbi:hypothetical protein OVW19_29660, partial [Klebsiella pneumoniae]|uniref:hypothetical protein n=1 Tax=Klebsiella pneumoniae TaxID=573 RepID=UPI0022715E8A